MTLYTNWPKLLYAVNDRVNQWLFQCCQEESVRETTLGLVRFSDLIIKLQLNEFICHLPVNIRMIAKDNSSPKKRETTQENQKATKKQKQEILSMVRNENIKEEWRLKGDESWNKFFRHKSKEAPTLSMSCRACLKYHVKGYCFQDCTFKESYVNLRNEDLRKTDAYIKSLQSWRCRQGLSGTLPKRRVPLDKTVGQAGQKQMLTSHQRNWVPKDKGRNDKTSETSIEKKSMKKKTKKKNRMALKTLRVNFKTHR